MQEVKAKKNMLGCCCCIVLAAWLSLGDAIQSLKRVCPQSTNNNYSL